MDDERCNGLKKILEPTWLLEELEGMLVLAQRLQMDVCLPFLLILFFLQQSETLRQRQKVESYVWKRMLRQKTIKIIMKIRLDKLIDVETNLRRYYNMIFNTASKQETETLHINI